MIPLDSPMWSDFEHAYGNAADMPRHLSTLTIPPRHDWDWFYLKIISAISHQTDIYNAAYAVAPYLVAYAEKLGSSEHSDEILLLVGECANPGGTPEVPSVLEDGWDDAQDEARQLIVGKFVNGEVSPGYASFLIVSLLTLSGEWDSADLVNAAIGRDPQQIYVACPACDSTHELSNKLCSCASTVSPEPLSIDFEFGDAPIASQLISLAIASGDPTCESQFRWLLGSVVCPACSHQFELLPNASG